jgi:hypothetical protein
MDALPRDAAVPARSVKISEGLFFVEVLHAYSVLFFRHEKRFHDH